MRKASIEPERTGVPEGQTALPDVMAAPRLVSHPELETKKDENNPVHFGNDGQDLHSLLQPGEALRAAKTGAA